MFLVSFTNFAYTKQFNNMDAAIAHMHRAGFESVLMDTKGNRFATYSPIGGFSKIKNF